VFSRVLYCLFFRKHVYFCAFHLIIGIWIEQESSSVVGESDFEKAIMSCKDGKGVMDNGKYVRYTPEQVEALERLYHDCPKPSSIRRQQLIRECPILSHIEPKQIKVWFQNRRYYTLIFFD